MDEMISKREAELVKSLEKEFPKLTNSAMSSADVVIIHQDAFAADYQDEEYALLGKFIKYCGWLKKEVRIIGKNRETLVLKDKV